MTSPTKAREVVTVRLETEKRAAVDEVARVLQRDRSFIINEAIDAYLMTHRWQIGHIERGLHQAVAGEFATDAEVDAAFTRWQR